MVYGLFHTAMQPKVALRIPLQTLRRDTHAAGHGCLVNAAEAAPAKGTAARCITASTVAGHCSHAHGQRPRLRLSSLSSKVTWLDAWR